MIKVESGPVHDFDEFLAMWVLQFIETLIKLEYNSTCEVRQQVSDKFECLRDPGDKFERCTNRIDS